VSDQKPSTGGVSIFRRQMAERGVIVEDQFDRCVRRIDSVEKLEKLDEFAAAMAIFDQRMDLAGDEIDAGQQANRAVAFVLMLAREARMARQVRAACRERRWRSPA
jgi:hypothetical protein